MPSDRFRKQLMIHRLLDLIQLRRKEIAANVLPGGLTLIDRLVNRVDEIRSGKPLTRIWN